MRMCLCHNERAVLLQLGGGILTNNYKFSESDEKQRTGRFWGGTHSWEALYVQSND